ncbi:MAG: alpha-(1-_3)-arabinofuranosyltransferase domain-containing protein [Frankia sp.]
MPFAHALGTADNDLATVPLALDGEAATVPVRVTRPGSSPPAGPASLAAGDHTPRWPLALLIAGFAALCLVQSPGKIVADTKMDIILAPGPFLDSALHFWNSTSDFGFLPNQYVGYLFPMGPFFLLGHLLGVAPWVTERLWWTLLLVIAAWGVVRMADALRIGRPTGRILAGLAYATSPVFLGKIGSSSVALTAASLLPWMIVPLLRCEVVALAVTGRRPVTRAGRRPLSPRRAAAFSGLAVAATGGVNASVTLCALVAPGILLLFAGRGRPAWAVRAWWCLSVLLATFWWILPLGLQGRYGLNFLAFTETATVTTAFTSSAEVLRGSADWLAYLRVPSPWIRAGYEYVTSPAAIVGSGVVAAVGVWGLANARRAPVPGRALTAGAAGSAGAPTGLDPRTRRLLVLTLVVGMLAIGSAYPGSPHSPIADGVRELLAGPLGFLRNVYKFEPVVRLPLALGLAHALGAAPGRLPDRFRWLARAPVGRAIAAVIVIGALVASTVPGLAGKLAPTGSFTKVPAYWTDAAKWLADNPAGGRTLVLPGSAFGEYDWGRPMDEPLQWLASSSWGVRSLIPLGGTGVTRLLDAIENELALGSAPGLAATLEEAGIGQVLVRNDLEDRDWDRPPSTDQINRALAGSGLEQVRSFGPQVPIRETAQERLVADRHTSKEKISALQVWKVPAGASRVTAYPTAATTIVSGGPEATAQLAARGMLGPGATVDATDLTPADLSGSSSLLGRGVTWDDTDTLTRRNASFGVVQNSESYLLQSGQNSAGHSGEPGQWLDVPPANHQTVAAFTGGATITASSYGFSLAPAPDVQPANVVDGNPSTAWQAQVVAPNGSTGAWVRIDLGHSVTVPTLGVRLLEEGTFRPAVEAIRVTTQRGSVVTPVDPVETSQVLTVPSGSTRWFQVSFEKVTRQTSQLLGAGIRELTIPGVTLRRYAVAPSDLAPVFADQANGRIEYLFDRYRADPTLPFGGDEETQLSRKFTVPRRTAFTVSGTAVAIPPFDGTKRPLQVGPLTVPCGRGPKILVDGKAYNTSLTGKLQDLSTYQPIKLSLCVPGSSVTLAAGTHVVAAQQDKAGATVSGLTLTEAGTAPAAPARRTTAVNSWSDERRTVAVGAGTRSFLVVLEDANASWTATMNGQARASVRIDGWQQGYVLPAGPGGTVVIQNKPGQTYQRDLVIGLLLVLGLMGLAAVPSFAPLGRLRPVRALAGSRLVIRAGAGRSRIQTTGRVGHRHGTGRTGVGRPPPGAVGAGLGRRLPLRGVGWVLVGTAAALLLAGWAAVFVPVIALLIWFVPGLLAWAAAALLIVATVIVAGDPGRLPASGHGAFSAFVQIAGALAIGCATVGLAHAGPTPAPEDPNSADESASDRGGGRDPRSSDAPEPLRPSGPLGRSGVAAAAAAEPDPDPNRVRFPERVRRRQE